MNKSILKNSMIFKVLIAMVFMFAILTGFLLFFMARDNGFSEKYGVFIGIDSREKNIEARVKHYQTVVVDADVLNKDQIKELKDNGHIVYSYLNIGSLETFRSYFGNYKAYTMEASDDFNQEFWMDVSKKEWQDFISKDAAKELIAKGVDGFFVGRLDLYYNYHEKKIYDGLMAILKELRSYRMPVILNGGDVFVSEVIESRSPIPFTGINQENIYTRVENYDSDMFGKQTKGDTNYYTDYLLKCESEALDIYIVEYTRDETLKKKIERECARYGWRYYIADSVLLK